MSDRNVSYAQNGEDIVLWRALGTITDGVYIDVGANDPTDMSVTRKFYNAGWSGIAIEPNHEYAELFRQDRPRDTIWEAVASDDAAATVQFHLIEGTGLSTLIGDISEEHAAAGWSVTDVEVPVISLTHAIEQSEYASRDIHFLSIDTEGSEGAVLRSLDFTRFRPWVLVIEATAPLSTVQVHENWQFIVEQAGYTFCLFDGLSRFYVANEHADDLAELLSYSASILDEWVGIGTVRLEDALTEANEALAAVNIRLRDVDLEWNKTQRAEADLREQQARLREQLDEQMRESARLGSLVADLQQTLSWRVTKPLRGLRGLTGGASQKSEPPRPKG